MEIITTTQVIKFKSGNVVEFSSQDRCRYEITLEEFGKKKKYDTRRFWITENGLIYFYGGDGIEEKDMEFVYDIKKIPEK